MTPVITPSDAEQLLTFLSRVTNLSDIEITLMASLQNKLSGIARSIDIPGEITTNELLKADLLAEVARIDEEIAELQRQQAEANPVSEVPPGQVP